MKADCKLVYLSSSKKVMSCVMRAFQGEVEEPVHQD